MHIYIQLVYYGILYNCYGHFYHPIGTPYTVLRLTLTMMLTVALGCKFLCEQPSGTEPVFARHHRFEEFCNMCCFAPQQQ